MIIKIKELYTDIVKVSKLSKVGKKKLRILLSIFLANVTVLTDLLIIVVFSRILGKELTSENVIIDFVLNNKYLLPFIIIFRFTAIYIEKTNIQLLVLQIMQNLKDYILREVYKRKLLCCRRYLLHRNIFDSYIYFLRFSCYFFE